MAKKNLWNRICNALGGSKTEFDYDYFISAVRKGDLKSVSEMLVSGYDVNKIFRCEDEEAYGIASGLFYHYYTALDIAGDTTGALLKAFGGMTLAEKKADALRNKEAEARQAEIYQFQRTARDMERRGFDVKKIIAGM